MRDGFMWGFMFLFTDKTIWGMIGFCCALALSFVVIMTVALLFWLLACWVMRW